MKVIYLQYYYIIIIIYITTTRIVSLFKTKLSYNYRVFDKASYQRSTTAHKNSSCCLLGLPDTSHVWVLPYTVPSLGTAIYYTVRSCLWKSLLNPVYL